MPAKKLRVVLIKPSKYEPAHRGGYVQRFRKGFMPNSTLPFIRSMTPDEFDGIPLEVFAIDEYVQTDLGYLELLKGADCPVLLALVGTQSHQFQRALDLALFAKSRGVDHCIIGGPHPMTCDTTQCTGAGSALRWPRRSSSGPLFSTMRCMANCGRSMARASAGNGSLIHRS